MSSFFKDLAFFLFCNDAERRKNLKFVISPETKEFLDFLSEVLIFVDTYVED